MPDSLLDIETLGSAGDGVAPGPVHIPRALPGEQVRVRIDRGTRAQLLEVLRPSPQRVAPPCGHFDALCGGCAVQHLSDPEYAAWKRGLVVAALERAGFAHPSVGNLVRTPPQARRRVDLAVRRREGGVLLGLHRANDKEVIDLAECPVMLPRLSALLAPLRKTLSSLAALRNSGSVLANWLTSGADLLIRTDGPLSPTDRAKLAAFATDYKIPRIAWALGEGPSETAAQIVAPHTMFGAVRVEPPPGAFLQASAEGEAAIVAAVMAGVPDRLTGKSFAVDLFAGCGTISFPLATKLRVRAYEGDAAAAAAVRPAQAGTRVELAQRDLARQPLSAKEFSGAAMIVLDPPYAGAVAQMPAVAASGVRRVVYVSCNPGALARDAAFLVKDYALVEATPIDQFLWSAQVECVAVFQRNGSPISALSTAKGNI